jgi:putative spermidine/putrescine transport system permease protein
LFHRLSSALYLHPRLLLLLLLTPPLLWLGVIYLGSLLSLLLQSFFYIDEFSGVVVREFSLATYRQLFTLSNFDIIRRTAGMAAAVTLAAAALAFPLAYYMVRYASTRTKALLYLAVMLPLWSSYLVRVYSWKLILAKEGIVTWLAQQLHLGWLLEGVLALPVIGGPSLSTSYLGTFLVFLYIWLPFMILPIQAALERLPPSLLQASADLGAAPRQTFMHVILPLALPGIAAALERVPRSLIEASADLGADHRATFRKVLWPLALPGVVAGSIFTFSLTLGDYIIPQIIGTSEPFLGQAVYRHQGTAGNVPMAAALTVVPIVIMVAYLAVARRLGAFDAL